MNHPVKTRACLLASLLCLSACAFVPHAFAKTYEVSACNYAPGNVNNSWVWSTNDPAVPAHYSPHTNCPYRLGGTGGKTDQEGGLSTTDALGLSNGSQPGTSAGWTFTTPADTTITAIDYERYLGHIFDSDNDWSPGLRTDGKLVTGESCLDTIANSETCYVGGPPGHGEEPAIITGLSAQQLTLGIDCQAPAEVECVTGATQHKVWATIYGASVTVSDADPPTLGTPTGPLWEPGQADGYHKGSESVTVAASDVGGGVQSIALELDGHVRQTFSAACDFTFPQPCPTGTGPQTLTLNTSELSDGPHTLTLIATDAAGNQSNPITEQINVDNDPPPAPQELKATETQPGSLTFTAEWADPPSQVAPISSATYQICPANGPGTCTTPTQAPARGPASVTVPGPGNWTLSVWLTDAAANTNPANAAYIPLSALSTGPGGGSTGSGPGSSGGDTGTGSGSGSSPPPNTSVRLKAALHGRKLVVHVSGPATGTVSLAYSARYRNKVIAHATKTRNLKKGRSTATFTLSARAAAHATITVTARVDHHYALSSTLPRHR